MTPEEFWNILHSTTEPVPVFYRLYYDDQGFPLFYSMEDLPGNYIDIDRHTFFQASSNVRVRNNKLVRIAPNESRKLVPGLVGTSCHPDNILILGDYPNSQKWIMKTYGSDC